MKAKPTPPADLWEQLDKEFCSAGFLDGPPPAPAFCLDDLIEKRGLSLIQAKYRMDWLREKGKIKRIGIWKRKAYYEFIG